MDDIRYPERIERMLDVMVSLSKNAWGLVLLDVEKKIGKAALQRVISRTYQIDKASMLGKGKGRKRKRRNATSAPTIIEDIPPAVSRVIRRSFSDSSAIPERWPGFRRER